MGSSSAKLPLIIIWPLASSFIRTPGEAPDEEVQMMSPPRPVPAPDRASEKQIGHQHLNPWAGSS